MSSSSDPVGRRIGRVRLVSRLGGGGMGEVYEGFDEALERRVAVKTIRPEHVDPEHRLRFRREARMLSKLDHPNVCRVWDLIEDDGGDHLILELIEGSTLRDAAELASFDLRLKVAAQIADALAAAHRLGIIHRDLKPDNIMLRAEQVKVLDFGLARPVAVDSSVVSQAPDLPVLDGLSKRSRAKTSVDRPGRGASSTAAETAADSGASSAPESPTVAGQVLGTLYYMSPEQLGGAELTLASDVYSLGILLQEFLTDGRAYADGLARTDLIQRVWHADTEPIRGVDGETAILLEELKRREPTQRPEASEVARRLRQIREKPRRRRRQMISAAISAVVVLAVIAAIFLTRVQQRRYAEQAVELVREMKDMEWRMRVVHGLPAHPIGPQKQAVRERIGGLRERIESSGDHLLGAGHAALGRGFLILGDHPAAVKELEAAVSAGETSTETWLALGLARGEMYRATLARSRAHSDPEMRRAFLERAEPWRDGAIDALRARDGAPRGPEEIGVGLWVEGLLAFYEQRLEAAREFAQQAEDRVPWLHEAALLRAEIEQASAEEDWAQSRSEDLAARYEAAIEAVRRAEAIAPSDPATHLAACRLFTEIAASAHFLTGEDPGSALSEASGACRTAVLIDAERADVSSALARSLSLEAEILMGTDPEQAVRIARESVEAAKQSTRLDADEGGGWQELSQSQWRLGKALWLSGAVGETTETTLQEAVDSGLQAANTAPSYESSLQLGLAALELANWKIGHRRDAEEALDTALSSFLDAATRRPERSRAYLNAALTYVVRARWESHIEIDPSASFAAGAEALERAFALNPRDPRALRTSAILDEERISYLDAQGEDFRPLCERAFRTIDLLVEILPEHPPSYAAAATIYGRCFFDWMPGGTKRYPPEWAWEHSERGLALAFQSLAFESGARMIRWSFEVVLFTEAERRAAQGEIESLRAELRERSQKFDAEGRRFLLQAIQEIGGSS